MFLNLSKACVYNKNNMIQKCLSSQSRLFRAKNVSIRKNFSNKSLTFLQEQVRNHEQTIIKSQETSSFLTNENIYFVFV